MVGGASDTEVKKEPIVLSEFGMPLFHDGQVLRPYTFFVPAISMIQEAGWEHMFESTSLTWVIIPYRSRSATDYQR